MPSILVEGISKHFSGVRAVDEASMTADDGRVTALIGPNGAGKTTLFNVISGFDRADAGRVTLDGVDVTGMPAWRVARHGLVRTFQTPVGFSSLTVWDNLLTAGSGAESHSVWRAFVGRRAWGAGQERAGERAEALLARLALEDVRDVVVADLSAADAKLLEIARALMLRPSKLLLDEPASGVEPSRLEALASVIRGLREDGITVVVIDHNLSFVLDIADYVYVLATGRIISEGAPAAVASDPIVVATYVGGEATP